MTVSANLDILHAEASQDGKVARFNTARDNLELALTNLLSKAVTDGADTVLTITEAGEALGNMVYTFTGALTANRNVEVPVNTKLYICENATTGGFSVTVKTNAGSGIAIPAGAKKTLYCDGTNVVEVGSGSNMIMQYCFGREGNLAHGAMPAFMETVGSVPGSITAGLGAAQDIGYVVTRAGSIIGGSLLFETTLNTVAGDLEFNLYKNGVVIFTSTAVTSGGLEVFSTTGTQGLGIDTVAVGDVLTIDVDRTAGWQGTINHMVATIEVAVTL